MVPAGASRSRDLEGGAASHDRLIVKKEEGLVDKTTVLDCCER